MYNVDSTSLLNKHLEGVPTLGGEHKSLVLGSQNSGVREPIDKPTKQSTRLLTLEQTPKPTSILGGRGVREYTPPITEKTSVDTVRKSVSSTESSYTKGIRIP